MKRFFGGTRFFAGRRFFAPEVVQTSNMDCGPAALKCLLEGFGRPISYGRLREACQTGIDGTSIDTMEAVAGQLGLQAEQIMLPLDHLFIAEAQTLPAIVVVKLPNGLTHFVVVWRRHGRVLQVMDPSIGRRWTSVAEFQREIYTHTMTVPAADWREFAGSDDFQTVLGVRLRELGLELRAARELAASALADESWRGLATLDAAVRMTTVMLRAGALGRGEPAQRFIERVCADSHWIPDRYWSVQAAEADAEDGEQLRMRGAVLVRVRGRRALETAHDFGPELESALSEAPVAPARELIRFLKQSGRAAVGLLVIGLALAAGAVLIEALLFRGLLAIPGELPIAGQRWAAVVASLVFFFVLLLLETCTFSGAARLGRQLENRLRMAFLEKIPKLGDRYFQSRLTSDMAERSHATYRLRHLPELSRQLLRALFELGATAIAIVWFEPSAAPYVLLIVAAALVPTLATQSVLAERDLRLRSHAAGLTRFYLDAMLGLTAIRAHSAETSVRREQEKLLGEWAHSGLRLQNAVVGLEGLQLIAMFALVAALLLGHPFARAHIGSVLLVVYWALNLPALGQEIAALARQYPYYRNLTLRLVDPLGAPEEAAGFRCDAPVVALDAAPRIEFRDAFVQASGHTILEEISLEIEAATQVAIVGPSGAGKSSLAGILLGWLKPTRGDVLIDGQALDCDALRASTAWVDPAVQLWNRSLLTNLSYGSYADPSKAGKVMDAAMLRGVLESLPEGLETPLGEGGALVSGGEGQRVRLGRAMFRDKVRLVILDEPFRGLDREKRRELLARARQFWRGSTLFCITHDISETRSFDRVLVVEHGRIVENGAPAELLRESESRYGQMLEAEHEARAGLWSSNVWRRIQIHSGRIVSGRVPENKPGAHKAADEKARESEVA